MKQKIYYVEDELTKNNIIKNYHQEIKKLFVSEENINDIFSIVANLSLFEEELYVLEDNYVFTSKLKQKDLIIAEKLIIQPNVIWFLGQKLKKDLKFYKSNQKNLDYQEIINSKVSYKTQINDYLSEEEIKISETNLELLRYNLQDDSQALINELNKLSLYNQGNIDKELIKDFSYKSLEENIFDVFKLIISNKWKAVCSLIDELIAQGVDETTIIGVYSSQIITAYHIKLLLQKAYDYNKIATKLEIHPYKAKITAKQISSLQLKELKKKLLKVSEIDYKIKSGQLSPQIAVRLIIQ